VPLADFAGDLPESVHELIDVVWPSVGKLVFVMSPDELVGVEFWGVCGEAVDVKSRMSAQQPADVLALVDGASIPEEHNRSGNLAQEIVKEDGYLYMGNVLSVEVQVEPEALSTKTDGDRRNGRDLVALKAMLDERCLSTGCPGPADVGNQEKA
jgi:hypothetical protein